MAYKPFYSRPNAKLKQFNQWDFIVLLLVLGLFASIVWGIQQMNMPFQMGKSIPISLDPTYLPGYAFRTVLRMGIALGFSLLFTFTIGTLAAKNARAERIIIPFIDIMQSVPILGFLSISIMGFIYLFPQSRLGPECAAIFALFTSQVWNIALSFYQSLRSVPKELQEATAIYHLNAWQRFWRLEVPFAIPSLIWNIMMSLSAAWFFVVASEAILVNGQNITLPGIGSYIMVAIQQSDYQAINYVILTMFLVILLYDQIIFRPLLAWSEKFKLEPPLEPEDDPWFLSLLKKATFIKALGSKIKKITFLKRVPIKIKPFLFARAKPLISNSFWEVILYIAIAGSLIALTHFIYSYLTLKEVLLVTYLGLITATKVMVLIILCSFIWIPVGVWIGLHPKTAKWVQPLAQFLAAFPANLVYPLVYICIVNYHLNVNFWSGPLMILGTQWYILFNIIAGASSLPQELHLVTQNFGVKGWLWWRKLILPGIFPYYVTGAMTAAGGCWNASIVAEVITWGDNTFYATGLGSYITQYTTQGDFPRIALGISIMSIYVIVINRLVWHKLYVYAEKRYLVA